MLTHWVRDKMDAISQTTFSSAFSWMKIFEFRLKYHWSLFLKLQLTTFQHWFRQWLGADQATSHYMKQWWFVCWRIYASLCLNELTPNVPHKNPQWMHHAQMDRNLADTVRSSADASVIRGSHIHMYFYCIVYTEHYTNCVYNRK